MGIVYDMNCNGMVDSQAQKELIKGLYFNQIISESGQPSEHDDLYFCNLFGGLHKWR